MKSMNDLKQLLLAIDNKSYPAYKETRGCYQFPDYVFSIEHVQGDPFASPSKVSISVKLDKAGFEEMLYDTRCKRIALQDQLLRRFAQNIKNYSFQAKGSGKSGLLSVSRPGQQILERSACQINVNKGILCMKLEIGFPANGRRINARELQKIVFDFLPRCVKTTCFRASWDIAVLQKAALLARDQQFIREQLAQKGLAAFVANGSILPRESGVSDRPLKQAVPFQSPEEMQITMELPSKKTITGMGIKEGVTLIVGGGYHGKSTLLKALERGVYNHIAGDGREYVITNDTAMKLRAEDGRSIQQVDISLFINDLPNGKDTTCFSTEDASGSTSQAANVVEAIEAGSKVFLIDEDTSATNFMVRDELMQRVVQKEVEPITPFLDRVRWLYQQYGISTILVAGSSGSYFHKADQIVQMNQYVPKEITEFAKTAASEFPLVKVEKEEVNWTLDAKARVVLVDKEFAKNTRVKLKSMGRDSVMINKDTIDLRYLEQLVDNEQLHTIAHVMKYAKSKLFDGKRSLQEVAQLLINQWEQNGFEGMVEGSVPGDLAMVRKQEIMAAWNRYRELRFR